MNRAKGESMDDAPKFGNTAKRALAEIDGVLSQTSADAAEVMSGEVLRAGTIVCYGLGREGLMVRALCMRLMHLGLRAFMAGDVTTPAVGAGDLLIVSAGPGELVTAETMIDLGRRAGARVLVVTAQPAARVPAKADVVVHLPAQTMADDQKGAGLLPMGTAFEISMLIFFDLVALVLMEETGQTMEQMRARHFNLE
jgi:6-phospho-3-hexuloisomerase